MPPPPNLLDVKRSRVRHLATSRHVLKVFAVVVALPLLLTVNSFRPIVIPPAGVLSLVEMLFLVLAYAPVELVRRLLFAPFGIDGVFKIPVISHLFVLASLFAFYYAVSLLLVLGWDELSRRRVGETIRRE